MVDYESDDDPKASRFSLRGFLIRDWPYLAMLALALFGVAYTSIARQSMTNYWIVLAPFYGVICVITRWRDIEGMRRIGSLSKPRPFTGLRLSLRCLSYSWGRKTNDELGRQRTHGADFVGAGDVYGRGPRCWRRAGPCRSRHRLARTSNSRAPIDSHCIAFDSRAVLCASSAGARILSRLRREHQRFSRQRRQKLVVLPEGSGALTTVVGAAVGSS